MSTSANIAISPPAQGSYKPFLNVFIHSTPYGLSAYSLLADNKPSAFYGSWKVTVLNSVITLDGGMAGQFAQMVIDPSSKTVKVSTRPTLSAPWTTETFTATDTDVFLVTL